MDLKKSLENFSSPDLDVVFTLPALQGELSTWWSHVPFAFWIMAAARPRVFVELGTHHGVSYAAFCEGNLRSHAGSRCYAVDTWAGDMHSGAYNDDVYNKIREFNERNYSSFSELLRCKFDDAVSRFADGCIDLLHIDGFHTYEAVAHDYNSWLPKLSSRAVILFHDTNVLRDDFGVHRLFSELSKRFPHFEFVHGYGLGIVAVGEEAPPDVRALCALTDQTQIGALRERFAYLGGRWSAVMHQHNNARLISEADAKAAQLISEADARAAQFQRSAEQAQRTTNNVRETLGEEILQLRLKLGRSEESLWHPGKSLHGEALARRYRAAFSDPSTGLKARLRRRLHHQLARFGIGRSRLALQLKADLIRQSIYFDRVWYLETYRDVSEMRIDPAVHYLVHGGREGRDPSSIFSSKDYRLLNPDLPSEICPLLHYIEHGEAEGRQFSSDLLRERTVRGVGYRVAVPILPAEGRSYSLLYVSGEPQSPGNIYRVTRYIEAAKINGIAARWIAQTDLENHLEGLLQHDALLLWRAPWDEAIGNAIRIMREAGKLVIFDLDDLMVEPKLAQASVIDGIRTQNVSEQMIREHYERIRRTLDASDVGLATTEELAQPMRQGQKPVHVLPNGFDQPAHDLSRHAARVWRAQRDGLIRIGYAGGSRTHQRDFGLAVEAIAWVLRRYPEARLVLFRTPDGSIRLIDVEEYPCLEGLDGQIEWRSLQPLEELPRELARFDINLAPLEAGNPFCEAKSELKFFEAALVDVPTVASPTGPFRRAIEHGVTGFLAHDADSWRDALERLVVDPVLRQRLGRAAYYAALGHFGPAQRAAQFGRVLDQWQGGSRAARGFALDAALRSRKPSLPRIYPSDVVFERDRGEAAEVSVIIPLYNYETYVIEALNSVLSQTLRPLDLIIVDGHSTDNSLAVAAGWARDHAERFNRIQVLQNKANYGLGFCRNSGFDAAETPYVLPLDADNRLKPDCCAQLLTAIKASGSAYVYPIIQHFGASSALISNTSYWAQGFAAGNYVDAMAMVSKEAWAIVGGYNHVRFGWEDYDFWCRIAEAGLAGEWLPTILAEYRVHSASMMTRETTPTGNYRRLQDNFTVRHPWTFLGELHTARVAPTAATRLTEAPSRLDRLLPILRCPSSFQKLGYNYDRTRLVSCDGLYSWPIHDGRPALAPLLLEPEIRDPNLISNAVPDEALEIIRANKGWVLNLSAGGSAEKFDHVVEVEYAVFRHTDLVADAHVLPFDDASFDAAIVMNAFEHYKEPRKVAAELLRVLKPGGLIHIRTAFLQPLHERPWHFFPCTRHGLEEWFNAFETETLHVSENFCPNHSVAWLAFEAEAALRREVSAESGDRFLNARVRDIVELWTDPSKRGSPLWTDFQRLSQPTQEITAAGFELFARKPADKPNLSA